jgi:hypothetical protein
MPDAQKAKMSPEEGLKVKVKQIEEWFRKRGMKVNWDSPLIGELMRTDLRSDIGPQPGSTPYPS